MRIRSLLKRLPLFWRYAARTASEFGSSAQYWENRYSRGGNSGLGSYGALAEFKAAFLNEFVRKNEIASVIEFGCGDGNQLSLGSYPKYIGLDVSRTILARTMERFRVDQSKSFFLYDNQYFCDRQGVFRSDLSLSLDVIYHLVEDEVFKGYIANLFGAAEKFVIIYSSDHDEVLPNTPHVRHRKFSKYVYETFPEWRLVDVVKNKFPNREYGESVGSFADFYVYGRKR